MAPQSYSKIILLIALAFALVPIAEASYLNDYYGPSYGTNYFNGFNSNTKQNTNSFGHNTNQFSNFNNYNSNSFFGEGFSNNNFGTFLQQGNINNNDGHNFNKDPCATKTTHGNFDGKGQDFTITEKVCDGISGNFYKDNSYQNAVNNKVGYNQKSVGVNGFVDSVSKSNKASGTNSNMFDNSFVSSYKQTTFGKGTKLYFN